MSDKTVQFLIKKHVITVMLETCIFRLFMCMFLSASLSLCLSLSLSLCHSLTCEQLTTYWISTRWHDQIPLLIFSMLVSFPFAMHLSLDKHWGMSVYLCLPYRYIKNSYIYIYIYIHIYMHDICYISIINRTATVITPTSLCSLVRKPRIIDTESDFFIKY